MSGRAKTRKVRVKADLGKPAREDGPLDRVKAAAAEHGALTGPEGFAALLGVELTDAERAQLRGRR